MITPSSRSSHQRIHWTVSLFLLFLLCLFCLSANSQAQDVSAPGRLSSETSNSEQKDQTTGRKSVTRRRFPSELFPYLESAPAEVYQLPSHADSVMLGAEPDGKLLLDAGNPLAEPLSGSDDNTSASLQVAPQSINAWSTNGPYGGSINSLVIDPVNSSTIYAGTSGSGVFKSTNGGANWSAANNGLPSTSVYVHALAIDPLNSSTIYAATGGVFKSTNGGASWSRSSNGINTAVRAVAVDPLNPNTVYAGSIFRGVFKSTNGGVSWSAANNGLTNLDVATLAINPRDSNVIYAVTNSLATGGFIFKSTDGGASWSGSNNGPPVTSVNDMRLAI